MPALTAAISTKRTPVREAGSTCRSWLRMRSSFGDPPAAIGDGIITGTGIECRMNVRARVTLLKDRVLERPIIAQGGAVHFVGVGPSV